MTIISLRLSRWVISMRIVDSLRKKNKIVSGKSPIASNSFSYSVLAFGVRRRVILVVTSFGRSSIVASRGVTIPSPSSPWRCSKRNDHSPDCMRTSSAMEKTDLNPTPFSPVYSFARAALFELLPVAQIASTFLRLQPSSLFSMTKVSDVTENLTNGRELLFFRAG